MGACGIAACHYEVCADVALVAEEVLLEHCHDGYDAGFAAGGEAVEFEVGGDEGGGEFGVGCGAGAGAPDLRGDVVEFFAVLEGRMLVVVHVGCLHVMGRTLSATMGPLVARVSAAMTTPPSYRQPTMVVPVDVAFGRGTPRACRARFRLWLEKSKPGMMAVVIRTRLRAQV